MLKASRLVLCVLLLLQCQPLLAQQGLTPAEQADTQLQNIPAPPTDSQADQATGNAAIRGLPVGLRELSPWSMFLNASLMVQAIMVGLAFASLVTWTTFVAKFIELFVVKRRLAGALRIASAMPSLSDGLSALSSDASVMRRFLAVATNETRLSADIGNDSGIKERVASSFAEITRGESRRIRFGMGALATIAATAPFVGLFGTVWGIMNSFIGISKLQTTNLAVVAPGIAEALLATGIGLFAAIPAVIIYNHFSRVTRGYLELVSRAAGVAGRQLSRDLDRMHAFPLRRAAE